MRLSRFAMLLLATVVATACKDDGNVTTPELPPLSYARFINAVPDTGAVDIRAVDQIEFSPVANNLAYRSGTTYFQTEAGVRHFRVFLTSTNIDVTSKVISDVTVTLPANGKFTLLLAGNARAGEARLWVIDDNASPPAAGQIGIRLVNAAPGVIDGYAVASPTTALPATPTFSNLGFLAQSSYSTRPIGAVAIRVADAGTTAVRASVAAPASPAQLPGTFPAAGVSSEGSVMSAYFFAAGVGANSAVTAPSVIWFVDRNPCDSPAAAGCQ
jgi:hypothetical protein